MLISGILLSFCLWLKFMDTKSLPFGKYKLLGIQKAFLCLIYILPANFLGRKIGLMLRWIFLRIWRQKCYDHQVQGIKARFYVNGNVSEKKFFFMPQFYDLYEREFIASNLSPDS